MAIRQDISYPRGQASTITASRASGTKSLVGCALSFTVKDPVTGLVVISKTTGAGQITISDPSFSVALVAGDTTALDKKMYRWDVWDTTNNDLLCYGNFCLTVPTALT